MKVTSHSADKFRNLKETFFEPCGSMNVIFGENGQGKTNIIESIWLFTGCYSFRTHKNSQLICEGEKEAKAQIDFFAFGRQQNAKLTVTKTKEMVLNGVNCESPREMMGKFCSVVFSPSTLSVVKGGPGDRRKLLDVALSLIKPNYASVMARYLRALDQRNSLLKKISERSLSPEYLVPWDETLSKLGAVIIKYRADYINELQKLSEEIYSGISGSRESFSVLYSFLKEKEEIINIEEAQKRLEEMLFKSREADLKRLYTGVGPHADDLFLELDGRDARFFGSQGQQRSGALALKLGEASIMGRITGEAPVVLLDDVMSELDEGRQRFILNYLDNWQVFITCCDPSQLMRSENGKIFEVINGKISEHN